MQAGYSILAALAVSVAFPAFALSQEQNEGHRNGLKAESVRKTCDCVRRHASGFPYIEQRITECKTYKDAAGKVRTLDCTNCYTICEDKPAG